MKSRNKYNHLDLAGDDPRAGGNSETGSDTDNVGRLENVNGDHWLDVAMDNDSIVVEVVSNKTGKSSHYADTTSGDKMGENATKIHMENSSIETEASAAGNAKGNDRGKEFDKGLHKWVPLGWSAVSLL